MRLRSPDPDAKALLPLGNTLNHSPDPSRKGAVHLGKRFELVRSSTHFGPICKTSAPTGISICGSVSARRKVSGAIDSVST